MTDTIGPPENVPELGENYNENRNNQNKRFAASLISAVPIAGPLMQTVITEIIPNVRMSRVEDFVRYLHEKIKTLELEAALKSPEGLDLFEEGMWQSARALSEARRKNISKLVAAGLVAKNTEREKARHFLRVFNQLGDEDIAILVELASRSEHQFNTGMVLARERLLASFSVFRPACCNTF